MNKLLKFFDHTLLKWSVAFTLAFTALYPKLPSINIEHTWVYIRLEDFLITFVVAVFVIHLLRKKASLVYPIGWAIIGYWVIGLLSLVVSLVFIAPHLANFFPKVAALQYGRRIEYMILFFAAFATIKSKKDVRDYLIILSITLTGIIIYGLGQRFYINLWHAFPTFFEKYPFCFPSFQTGNEEFAKGIPLCLPPDARLTSTFGGHYDLAAYMVFIVPVLVGICIGLKRISLKIGVALLGIGSLLLLVLTSSRTSFAAYLVAVIAMLIFLKQKKWIIPVVIVSIGVLVLFSGSTIKRFAETFHFASVVTNNQGQVVGVTSSSLPSDLQNKISKNPVVVGSAPPTQNLPQGSSFFTLPGERTPVATNVAVVKTSLSSADAKKLNLTYGGEEISTVSGSFLIQKALVYDISFTTRFQGEWPHAWAAFMKDPPLGTGYSSITLASDNDYLRALGESGFLGLGSFLFIFLLMGILLKETGHKIKDNLERSFVFGLAGGVLGLFLNATLIDVFEASKVAEPLWILLGIGVGTISLYKIKTVDYRANLCSFFTSKIMLAFYLLMIVFIFFMQSINNFFVADDFSLLHQVATATMSQIPRYFLHAGGNFYRPIAKALLFFLYTFFYLLPQGYHFFIYILHFFMGFGVFLLLNLLFKNKYLSFLGAVVFLLMPSHPENLYWIATLPTTLYAVFSIFAITFFLYSRVLDTKHYSRSIILYVLSLIFSFLALFSHEMAVVIPLLIILSDLVSSKVNKTKVNYLLYSPYILLDALYVFMRSLTHVTSSIDYTYTITHTLQNFLGYISLFIIGEPFLSMSANIRNGFSLCIALLLGVGLGIIVYFAYTQKKYFISIPLFALLFSFIALIPVLGFGNISQNYGYLASVGFVIFVVYLLQKVSSVFTSTAKHSAYRTTTIAVLVLSLLYAGQINHDNKEWQSAGEITKKTLGTFRYAYPNIPHNANLYFVNVPKRNYQARIFSTGVSDALWFIYRDPTIKIVQVKSLDEAKALRNEAIRTTNAKDYILVFDKNDDLQEQE